MKRRIFVGAVLFVFVLLLSFWGTKAVSGAEVTVAYKNIALNKPYTMQPAPNYKDANGTEDPDDKIQLTDGQSFGSSWSQKTTVGWQSFGTGIVITIDLGAVEPIRGVSVATAAGAAGVTWPSTILVMVSEDNKSWHSLGDLTVLGTASGVPPENGSYRYRTDQLKAHGRYVQFFVKADPYFFSDEIEVYQGEDAWLKLANPGPAIDNPKAYEETTPSSKPVKNKIK
jgi:hypothetical protein